MKYRMAVLLFCLCAMPAWATDIGALVDKQRELLLLKLDNQIKDERSKHANAAQSGQLSPRSTLGSRGESEQLELAGIYGIGRNLEAHIVYNGALQPMKVGMTLSGWRLAAIEDRAAVLANVRTGKQRYLYLRTVPVAIQQPAAVPAPLVPGFALSPIRPAFRPPARPGLSGGAQ